MSNLDGTALVQQAKIVNDFIAAALGGDDDNADNVAENKNNNKVVLHGNVGNNRSAALMVAHVMEVMEWDTM